MLIAVFIDLLLIIQIWKVDQRFRVDLRAAAWTNYLELLLLSTDRSIKRELVGNHLNGLIVSVILQA